MFKKEVIIGNFIKKNKVLSYLEYIHNTFNIKYDNLFVYTISDNDAEYMVTFKIIASDKSVVKEIKGSHIFHYKKGCLFSINALNKIKDETNDLINWEDFSNKLLLINDDKLVINDLNKIDDKSKLFV